MQKLLCGEMKENEVFVPVVHPTRQRPAGRGSSMIRQRLRRRRNQR